MQLLTWFKPVVACAGQDALMNRSVIPLVYSCSGCSDAAQLANHLAVRLDRAGLAEMSCIAGVGGGVSNLVRKAREAAETGRPILALDGCVLACTRACLGAQGLAPSRHLRLHEMGVRKHYHADFDAEQADQLFGMVADVARSMNPVGHCSDLSNQCAV